MQLKINRKFLKELAVLPDKDRKRIEQFVFEDSINFENLNDVTGIKKTQGISKL
jgi:mRNA interferase RelE/StbE